jgi:hypothetical protein
MAGNAPILALPDNFGHIVAPVLVGSAKKLGAAVKIDQTPTGGPADLKRCPP